MDSSRGPASFTTQANALLRKNLCLQKRNLKTNIGITFFPILICVLLVVLQNIINNELDKPKYKCGCVCVEVGVDGRCARKQCGIQYSTLDQVASCPIPSPPRWPALIQVPRADFRAVRSSTQPFSDLPDPSCRDSWSCPATVLVTGKDPAIAEIISRRLFPALSPSLNATDFLDVLSKIVVGSDTQPWYAQLLEPAFSFGRTLVLGYDFLNTTEYGLGVNVWYNSTYNDNTAYSFIATLRVPRLVNAVSNAYLKSIKGTWGEMLLEYVKDMPKVGTSFRLDLSSLLSALFFTWIIELLFPVSMMNCADVMLTYLVYEKQQKLRIMMRMHGLKDGPYWLISYSYFLTLSVVYMLFFVIFGTLIVIGYMYVFGSGLLGAFLFRLFVEDTTFPYGWILVMETVPGFSLYRGLYELGQYAFSGSTMGTSGGGARKNPLSCFRCFKKKLTPSLHEPSFVQQDSKIILDMEKPDVVQERAVVEQLLIDPNANQAIICDNLRKVYPGRDGNPDKLAVRGLSLVLQKGQCFGMLGPNGAGKTSFINMMIGLVKPTSGTAYVHGMDINKLVMGDIDRERTSVLLWQIKKPQRCCISEGTSNLAVDDSLKSVNLFHGNVGDKKVQKYSGGMKRRLAVAISLIGDPKAVFMDEPSTGLDPASRNNLWNVVKEAKRDRAIILTTHSMEEAEVLCDRLGIFVDGGFQCLGNPKELKGRFGGTYIFTMTTAPEQEQEVEQLVRQLSPSANKIYHLSGTQKFELPKQEVKIAQVFQAVENAKSRLTIHAWGLVDTTLEDVFIKVARGAQAFNEFA
ncbi:hypothetical protein EJB05_42752 [Eragrostis curvula]|uniref:ABC transporter domain-containing protein n=1 Tax=Eragrostis curvula TaxID=38414 RepID=A0A5J9TD76_9POAL|nr:hypothetical protein EJB05_42752 [Eragrostis curvula]